MIQYYKVKTKRSIFHKKESYSIMTNNLKIIELKTNKKEMNSFSIGDFISVKKGKIIKVIPKKYKKYSLVRNVKLKK